MTADLEEARECYFAAGGLESQLGPRDDAGWYWRRAAKLWRHIADVSAFARLQTLGYHELRDLIGIVNRDAKQLSLPEQRVALCSLLEDGFCPLCGLCEPDHREHCGDRPDAVAVDFVDPERDACAVLADAIYECFRDHPDGCTCTGEPAWPFEIGRRIRERKGRQ